LIEFYGSLSENCIKKTEKRKAKRFGIVCLFVTILSVVITTTFAVFHPAQFYYFLIWTILIGIVNILIFVIPARSIIFRLPKRIVFKPDENLITIQIDGLGKGWSPVLKYISKVKEIIDEGEWYFIIFKYDITDTIVCQKDLIIQGTIEEFEKLFEGKIKRNSKV